MMKSKESSDGKRVYYKYDLDGRLEEIIPVRCEPQSLVCLRPYYIIVIIIIIIIIMTSSHLGITRDHYRSINNAYGEIIKLYLYN